MTTDDPQAAELTVFIFICFVLSLILLICFKNTLVLISSSTDSIGTPEKRVEWKRISCNQYSPKGSQIGAGERAEKYGLIDSQELALNGTGKGSGRTNVEKSPEQQPRHPLQQHQGSPPKHVAWEEDKENENEKEKDREKESEKEEETEEKAESDKDKEKEKDKESEKEDKEKEKDKEVDSDKEKEKEKEVDSDKEKETEKGEKSSPSQQRLAPVKAASPKRAPKGKVQIAPTTPDQSDKKPEYGKEKARNSKANLTKSATPRPLLAMRSMGELHVYFTATLSLPHYRSHAHSHTTTIAITTDGQKKNLVVKAVVG